MWKTTKRKEPDEKVERPSYYALQYIQRGVGGHEPAVN